MVGTEGARRGNANTDGDVDGEVVLKVELVMGREGVTDNGRALRLVGREPSFVLRVAVIGEEGALSCIGDRLP